jgi:hypothetical protein
LIKYKQVICYHVDAVTSLSGERQIRKYLLSLVCSFLPLTQQTVAGQLLTIVVSCYRGMGRKMLGKKIAAIFLPKIFLPQMPVSRWR